MTGSLNTGGCQCGAVRFRCEGEMGRASICHCRMCQKAFGSFFAPLVSVHKAKLAWTRGEPSHFQSSRTIRRGFCKDCGTPLTYEHPGGVELAIGAFDHPEKFEPQVQVNFECRLPWIETLFEKRAITPPIETNDMVSFQHPDCDVPDWTPPSGRNWSS